MHVLKTGCLWQDCPPEYGPHTTVYRPKDFKRIAMSYDKLAKNYFLNVCLVVAAAAGSLQTD